MADLKARLDTLTKSYKVKVNRALLQRLHARRSGVQLCISYLKSQLGALDAEDHATDNSLPKNLQNTLQTFVEDILDTEDESQPAHLPVDTGLGGDVRRRRTATSSTAMPYNSLTSAANHGLATTVDHLRDIVHKLGAGGQC